MGGARRCEWDYPKRRSELEERKLINLDKPSASLLKTKALGQDDHGGGVKFPVDGQTDLEWGRFLEDYAAIKRARYKTLKDVPSFSPFRTWRTGLHLRIKELPQLPVGQYAVIRMHRINEDGTVTDEAVAFGEGRVSGDGTSWNTSLMILEPARRPNTNSSVDWNALLPDGRYQLRWTAVDDSKATLEEIIAMQSTARLDIDSLWKSGHNAAKTISFGLFLPVAQSK